MKHLVINALVCFSVGVTVFFSFAMLRMRDAYQQIHFMSPPAALGAPLLALAILLQQGVKPESFKAFFIVFILLLMNSIVSHATARAFRIRENPDRPPAPNQEVPISATDEIVP